MIKFYLHIGELPGWVPVFADVIDKMAASSMVNEIDEINLCLNGNKFRMMEVIDPLLSLSTVFRVRHVNPDATKWEWPTINLIKLDADHGPDNDFIGYGHLKGLSPALYHSQPVIDWRNYLTYWTVERWKDQVKALYDGYDTSGVNWLEEPQPHYTGNSWWARSGYIKDLARVEDPDSIVVGTPSRFLKNTFLDPGNFRYECEAWIGSGPANTRRYEIHHSPAKFENTFHYHNLYPEHLYK